MAFRVPNVPLDGFHCLMEHLVLRVSRGPMKIMKAANFVCHAQLVFGREKKQQAARSKT